MTPRVTRAHLKAAPATVVTAIIAVAATVAWWSGFDPENLVLQSDALSTRPWVLITTVFFHIDPIHLCFNLYWLWYFGARLEPVWGSARFTGLAALLGIASSAAEYALAGGGVGLSGVGYGLFGFLYYAQQSSPALENTVTPRVSQTFVVWFFLCIAATVTGLWQVANVAHGAGAIVGAAIGRCIIAPANHRRLRIGATLALLALIGVGATLARPWVNIWPPTGTSAWAGHKALTAGDNQRAVTLLTQAVQEQPDDFASWVNLGSALTGLDRTDEALKAYKKAWMLEPGRRAEVSPSIAWLLAERARKSALAQDFTAAERDVQEALRYTKTPHPRS